MQAQREAPPDMQFKDKFLFQNAFAAPGATQNDVKPEIFDKEPGKHVEECRLRVVYASPPQPPSPVAEVSDEGSSPRTCFSENASAMGFESEILRKQASTTQGGYPFLYMAIVGLLGILIGYLMRS